MATTTKPSNAKNCVRISGKSTKCYLTYSIAVAHLLLTLFGDSALVLAFNLENRLPIIKYGDKDTYFGYSVASHVTGEKDEANNQKW